MRARFLSFDLMVEAAITCVATFAGPKLRDHLSTAPFTRRVSRRRTQRHRSPVRAPTPDSTRKALHTSTDERDHTSPITGFHRLPLRRTARNAATTPRVVTHRPHPNQLSTTRPPNRIDSGAESTGNQTLEKVLIFRDLRPWAKIGNMERIVLVSRLVVHALGYTVDVLIKTR